MALGENLQYIRGKFSLTQEQLAEKLEVSRQSVSKWESGASFPEMDKILLICELYGVSVDELMRGDVRKGFATDNADYDGHMNSFSKSIALGVGLVILGVAVMILLGVTEFSESIPVIAMFAFIIAAVPIFIVAGLRHEEFCKKHPYIENFYTQAQIDAYNRKFPLYIAIPVAVILLGVVLIIATDELVPLLGINEHYFVFVFMLMLAGAVPFLVYGGIQKSKYDINEYNRDNYCDSDIPKSDAIPEDIRQEFEKNRSKNNLIGRICGGIMMLATVIFFLLGFGFDMWDKSWIAFPIGGMLCGLAAVIIGDQK
jgi:transcriptional regulator with XRE-family HTH domain